MWAAVPVHVSRPHLNASAGRVHARHQPERRPILQEACYLWVVVLARVQLGDGFGASRLVGRAAAHEQRDLQRLGLDLGARLVERTAGTACRNLLRLEPGLELLGEILFDG